MGKVFCLKEKGVSGECHLFECEMTSETNCSCNSKSVCKKMGESERVGSNLFSCASDKIAREKIAQIGRGVCGTCVSHLYETY